MLTISPSAQTSFSHYLHGLLKLHRLSCEGSHESEAADALRDELDDSWHRLSDREQTQARWLSHDLYSIDPTEVAKQQFDLAAGPTKADQEVFNAAIAAKQRGEWFESLDWLRQLEHRLPTGSLSELRGRVWYYAGYPEVAAEFLKFAITTNSRNDAARAFLLQAYSQFAPSNAVALAHEVLAEPESHDVAVIARAASAFVSQRQNGDDSEGRLTRNTLVEILHHCLERLDFQERQSLFDGNNAALSVARAIWAGTKATIGRLYERDGDFKEAYETYCEGLSRYPGDDVLSIGLAQLLIGTNDNARSAWQLSFDTPAQMVVPHLRLAHSTALAHQALLAHDHSVCIANCDAALQLASNAELQSALHEWKAIALAGLGSPTNIVQSEFAAAIEANPSSESARNNLQYFLDAVQTSNADSRGRSGAQVVWKGDDLQRSTEILRLHSAAL